jgi:nucleotide-binding universal stress UspA family protein
MRVLIGYNGSSASAAIFEDLQFAGVPPNSEIGVLVVVDPIVFPKSEGDAAILAANAEGELHRYSASLTVDVRIVSGNAADEIINASELLHPDLLMLGEPGHADPDGRFRLGPVSMRAVSETNCSVRICRAPMIAERRPARILIGYDGSAGAKCAVESLLSRTWPNGLDVRFLAVADSTVLATIGRFAPQINDLAVSERYVVQWAETLCERSRLKLREAGIGSEVAVRFGDPTAGILAEAFNWRADSILVGPHSFPSVIGRATLGSVSLGVAAEADRSVEVCRCFDGSAI